MHTQSSNISKTKRIASLGAAVLLAGVLLAGPAGAQAPGSEWTFVGPEFLHPPIDYPYFGPPESFLSGRVNGIAFDRTTPGTAYLTGAQAGAWGTTDGGRTWVPLSDGDPRSNPPKPGWETLIASAVAVNPTNGNFVYVGLGDYGRSLPGLVYGVMRSKSRGVTGSWARLGQTEFDKQLVSAIVVDPENPNIVTATTGRGASPGHIWRSTDGGDTWSDVTPIGPGPAGRTGNWSSIDYNAYSSVNQQRWYYATLEGVGVFRSVDRGATWTQLNVPLVFNKEGSGAKSLGLKVGASKVYSRVIYVSDASGFDTAGSADGRIFKSTDGGVTWTDISGSFPTTAGNINNFSGATSSLFMTPVRLKVPAPELGAGQSKLIDMVYGGAVSLAATPGGGPNWTDVGFTLTSFARMHSNQQAFAEDPLQIHRALVANGGGIYGIVYDQTRNIWNIDGSLSATLGITAVNKADWANADADRILAGSEDIATASSAKDATGGVHWNVVGTDQTTDTNIKRGGGCAISSADPNIQFATTDKGEVFMTPDGWATKQNLAPFTPLSNQQFWQNTNLVTTTSTASPTPVLAITPPLGGSFMYYGTNLLWRWNGAWESDTGTPPKARPMGGKDFGSPITAIAVSPTDLLDSANNVTVLIIDTFAHALTAGQVVYVGTANGQVWATFNAQDADSVQGTVIAWFQLNNGTLPAGRPVKAITINPNNAGDILVALGGTASGSDGYVYRLANVLGGDLRFSDQSGFGTQRLSSPINDLSRDPQDPINTLYAAADNGVWVTNDAGSTWRTITGDFGLPSITCTAIKAADRAPLGSGFLNVATFGRGLWRIPLAPAPPTDLSISQVTLKRSGGQITVSISIINQGSEAFAPKITAAAIQADRGQPVATTSAMPQPLGGMAPGAFRLATLTFPDSVGGRGTAATVTATLNFNGTQSTTIRLRTRLP
jgi:hypothetical protein